MRRIFHVRSDWHEASAFAVGMLRDTDKSVWHFEYPACLYQPHWTLPSAMPIQVAAGNGLDAVHAFGALGQSLYGKALTSGHSLAWQFGSDGRAFLFAKENLGAHRRRLEWSGADLRLSATPRRRRSRRLDPPSACSDPKKK